MVKRIVAAVFAAAVVLVPMSPANAADKAPSKAPTSKAIDWEAPGKSSGKVGTLRIDWY